MTPTRPRPVSAGTAAGLIVVIAAVDVVTTRLAPPGVDPVFRVTVIAGLLLWARRRVGLSWSDLGCAREKLGSGLRWGLLAMAVLVVGIGVMVAIPSTRSYFENGDVRNATTVEHVLEPLLIIPIRTVLFEELIFRGVLLAVLLRVTTRLRAVVLCSVAFGLWHIPPALSDANGKGAVDAAGVVLGTIAFTTVAGLVFAWLRLRSGSLLAPILAHIGANSFAYLGALVALS